jgi:putative transposase
MSRPKRLLTHNYVGRALYFLTFCTYKRRKAFSDSEVAARTLEQFRRTAAIEQFAILAYCLMPDHAHLLVQGTAETSDLKRFAKMAKQRSGGIHRRQCGVRLWQEGYFERVLRDGDDVQEIARYIVENPIRAGLGDGYPRVEGLAPLLATRQRRAGPVLRTRRVWFALYGGS